MPRVIFGPLFRGLNRKMDAASMTREESPSMCGVKATDGGIVRLPGLVRVQEYGFQTGGAAGFAGTGWVQVQYGSATWHLLGTAWSVFFGLKPTGFVGNQFILALRRTISGSDYYCPSIYFTATGYLKVAWTTSGGSTKTLTAASPLVENEAYSVMVTRLDDTIYLYVSQSDVAPTSWGTVTGLGARDVPGDTGTHHLIVGADGDKANGLVGILDGLTILKMSPQETDLMGVEHPAPRVRSCLLHMPLDEAAGSEFTDESRLSAGYTITHAAGVTHQETALLKRPNPIQFLGYTRVPGGIDYANVIVGGQLFSTRLNQ